LERKQNEVIVAWYKTLSHLCHRD